MASPVTDSTSAGARNRPGGVGYAPHRRSDGGGRLRRAATRFREKAAVRAYRATSWLLAHLPLGATVAVARIMFLAGYLAWPSKRRAITANASHVLRLPPDDPAVRRLARSIYTTYARYVVELMRLPARPTAEHAGQVEIRGERGIETFTRIYERLRDEGRATIIVTAHIGNIEALAAATAALGFPAYGVADDSAYPELYELLAAQRRAWGVEVIAWRNLREIHRVLREKAILALLVDWGYRADGVPVRLFDAWTTLPAGPAVLAARTGAAIVPVVNRRLPDGTYAAEHGEVIEVPDTSPAAIALASQAVANALERMVAVAPEQWYTFKPMWPDSPAEAEELAARARAALEVDPAGEPANGSRRLRPRGRSRVAPSDPEPSGPARARGIDGAPGEPPSGTAGG
jgi:KDO2-lipid IV(A) lauroyltransferase